MAASSQLLAIERLVDCIGIKYQENWYNDIWNFASNSQANTVVSTLEAVFTAYYAMETDLRKDTQIPENYIVDWEAFETAVGKAALNNEAFNGICAVMHVRMGPAPNMTNTYQIYDIGIRPCVIERSFYRRILQTVATNLLERSKNTPDFTTCSLILRTVGIRKQYAEKVLSEIGIGNVAVVNREICLRSFSKIPATYYVFRVIGLKALQAEASLRGWQAPTAQNLNDLTTNKRQRNDMIGAMIKQITSWRLRYALYLLPDDNTFCVPEPLQLDPVGLKVYRDGKVQEYASCTDMLDSLPEPSTLDKDAEKFEQALRKQGLSCTPGASRAFGP